MKINQAGLELIKAFEGLSLKPYKCPAGLWTIGYGSTAGVTKNTPPITRAQAEELLLRNVREAESVVNTWVKVPLNENQFSALTSFVFNVGPGRKGYKDGFVWLASGKNSTMLTLLNDGRYEAAAQQFDRWIYGGGKELPGLKRRRAAEKALFLTKPTDSKEAMA